MVGVRYTMQANRLCRRCGNHDRRIFATGKHINGCPYLGCDCRKCALISGLNPSAIITNTVVKDVKSNGFTSLLTLKESDSQVVVTNDNKSALVWPSRPLETIRELADKLSNIDAPDDVIQKSILYAVLEDNHFSADASHRVLEEARRAITESLVLPAFDDNRQSRLKRVADVSYEVLPMSLSPPKSIKQDMNVVHKARKTVPSLPSHRQTLKVMSDINGNQLSINSSALNSSNTLVETNTSPQTRLTSWPLVISPKLVLSTQTQTKAKDETLNKCNITNQTSVSQTSSQNPVLVAQLRRPVPIAPKQSPIGVNVCSLNANQSTYMLMPISPNSNPIQMQIPTNTYSRVVIANGSVHHINGQTNASSISPNADTNVSPMISPIRAIDSATPRYITLSTPSTSTRTAQLVTKVATVSANMLSPLRNQKKRLRDVFIRKIDAKSHDRVVNDKITAKNAAIITREAALAALAAISPIKSSSKDITSDNNNKDNTNDEYILPDSDDSIDTVVIHESTTTDLKTTSKSSKSLLTTSSSSNAISSDQFYNTNDNSRHKLKTKFIQNASNFPTISIFNANKPNKQTNSSSIVQITID